MLSKFPEDGFTNCLLIFSSAGSPSLALLLPRLVTGLYARSLTYSIENVPSAQAAIVFGAGLWRDGSPTPVLRDRVATAAGCISPAKWKS